MPPFGSFSPLCSLSPLPACTLLLTSLLRSSPPSLALPTLFPPSQRNNITGAYTPTGGAAGIVTSSSSKEDLLIRTLINQAGVGVGEECVVRRMNSIPGDSQLGDIAQIVLASLSTLFILFLIYLTSRRRAAVGRSELRIFFTLYLISLPLGLVSRGGFLVQGGTGLAVVTALEMGVWAGMGWVLLGNGIVATQVVEDGTPSSLLPLLLLFALFFAATTYISLDTALGISSVFKLTSREEVEGLRNVGLFVLVLIWPAVAVVAYLLIMLYVVYFKLREIKPCLWFLLSFALFAGGQVVFFLTSQPLCRASNQQLTSAFLGTLMNTAAVGVLYLAWKSITEDDWDEDPYYG